MMNGTHMSMAGVSTSQGSEDLTESHPFAKAVAYHGRSNNGGDRKPSRYGSELIAEDDQEREPATRQEHEDRCSVKLPLLETPGTKHRRRTHRTPTTVDKLINESMSAKVGRVVCS